LKAVNMLDQNYGNVFVDFGEAISVREFLKGDFSFISRSKVKEVNQITRLAFTVINR
jgi:glycerol-3-phosphate O-acyltransferase